MTTLIWTEASEACMKRAIELCPQCEELVALDRTHDSKYIDDLEWIVDDMCNGDLDAVFNSPLWKASNWVGYIKWIDSQAVHEGVYITKTDEFVFEQDSDIVSHVELTLDEKLEAVFGH